VELLTLALSFPCNRKRYYFEITWFSNSQKLLFARYCDSFTSDTPGSPSLYTSDTSGIKGTKALLIHGMNQLSLDVTKLTLLGLYPFRNREFIPVFSNAGTKLVRNLEVGGEPLKREK